MVAVEHRYIEIKEKSGTHGQIGLPDSVPVNVVTITLVHHCNDVVLVLLREAKIEDLNY